MAEEALISSFKRFVVGKPIPSHLAHHNQRALLIKGALLFRRNTVVTSVPFHLDR